VEFFITENQYLAIARFLQAHEPSHEEGAVRENLELILADDSVYPSKGKIDFIDRSVDPTTGAMLVQASFPNADGLLRPGLFAKIRAMGRVVEDGILIPQRCVMELQGIYSVYVIEADNTAKKRTVKAGPKIETMWLIEDGLKPGEKVVYEGLQKVKDGLTVKPVKKQNNFKEKTSG